jgi:phosphoglycolate phosphatase-like HAD superfamily hydrolase
MDQLVKGHIIFDHDGTLVSVSERGFSVFLGLKELLTHLVSQNYRLYIWTARGRQGTIISLKENNVLQYFTALSCAEDGVKPNINGLVKMLDGICKTDILHIGDSKGDLVGARNFGIDCVLAAWNNEELGRELKGEIPYIANSIDELKKIIELKFS